MDKNNFFTFGLSEEEVKGSVCELGALTPDSVQEFDIVVVGAGAAGVVAAGVAAEAGARVALLQKEATAVSQGNCGSAIIKSRSTEAGIAKWIHHTNGLCDWRADTKQLKAYTEHSEEAMMWLLNRAGLTKETEYGDGSKVDDNKNSTKLLNDGDKLCAFISTSNDFTGVWRDRENTSGFRLQRLLFLRQEIIPTMRQWWRNGVRILQNLIKSSLTKQVMVMCWR